MSMLLAAIILAATCDTPGEPPAPTTAAERRATYQAIRTTCADLGASEPVCEAMVAMAWRESRGRPTLTHTRGPNELGYGLFGHSPRFWGWLVRPQGHDAFCTVGTGVAALLREFQFAYSRGARRIEHLQRVHAGRNPRDDGHPYADARWCYLLAHGPRDDQHVVDWDVDCETRIEQADLGRPLTDAFFTETP